MQQSPKQQQMSPTWRALVHALDDGRKPVITGERSSVAVDELSIALANGLQSSSVVDAKDSLVG